MRRSSKCACLIALFAGALASGCGTPTNPTDARPDRTDGAVGDSVGDMGPTDSPVMDTPDATSDADDVTDAGMDAVDGDGARACMSNMDCASDPNGPVCDTASGRCVQCLPSMDSCPADQHCDAVMRRCVAGCRSDEGCMGSATDGGVEAGVPVARCDTAAHVCVECLTTDHCPIGFQCVGNRCAAGCSPMRGCPMGQTCCGTACVDVNANPAHCGACGMACMLDRATAGCAAGACTVASCMSPFADCDMMPGNGCEVDTSATAAHCGGCGMACPTRANAASTCAMGTCGIRCNMGFADCDGDASNGCEVDTTSSAAHCGMCGRACSVANGTAGCAMSACTVASCNAGFGDCDTMAANGCETDTRTTLAHCGGCGMACTPRANSLPTCAGGTCGVICNPGFGDCDGNASNGCEVDLNSSAAHCSACGSACSFPNASGVCSGGFCSFGTCNPGFANCNGSTTDGCEVNLATDRANCGACRNVCSFPFSTSTCSMSMCRIGTCIAGFADCDMMSANGCETDVNNSAVNCGACGRLCSYPNATSLCSSGTCNLVSCAPGFANCDMAAANGCEVDLGSSVANCGACGNLCTVANGTASCAASTCGIASCNMGFGNCDGSTANGCESNLNTNAMHCGACGRVCNLPSATSTCTGGTCAIAMCNAGFGDCDMIAGNGCEVSLDTTVNCGACGRACAMGQVCSAGACITMPPPNDTRAGATVLDLTNATQTLLTNTTNATNHTTGSCTCTNGRDVFYRFTLTRPEIVYADTLTTPWDTSLFLQDAAGANIAASGLPTGGTTCNDNGGLTGCATGAQSQVLARLAAGTYYLVLSGCSFGAATLRFQHLQVGNGPLAFLNAGAGLVVGGTTAGTGTVTGVSCGGGATGPENTYYWFSCPAYAGGASSATTCGRAAWDTVLYQRSASRPAEVCADDSCALQSTINPAIPAGAGIHALYVDGFGAAAGAYTMLYTRP